VSDEPMQAEPVVYCEHRCLKDEDHIERGEPHFYGYLLIPESEKRQKEPEMGVSVDAKTHPDYPIRHGIPAMDRCICGGVRHWHAVAPYGCDDCECTEFTLNENWRP
jgi:hypothetical protein